MPFIILTVVFLVAVAIAFIVSRVVFALLFRIFEAIESRRVNYLPFHLINHPANNRK